MVFDAKGTFEIHRSIVEAKVQIESAFGRATIDKA